jgi:hypothetical protein
MQSSLFFNRIAMCDVLDMDADKDLAGQVVSRPVDDITAQEGKRPCRCIITNVRVILTSRSARRRDELLMQK